jgi:hypothetical protein
MWPSTLCDKEQNIKIAPYFIFPNPFFDFLFLGPSNSSNCFHFDSYRSVYGAFDSFHKNDVKEETLIFPELICLTVLFGPCMEEI